jgi:hypothetical protein
MEIDSPAWVAFAAAGDLAELRLLPVPKMLQLVGLAREARQAPPDGRGGRSARGDVPAARVAD